MKSGAIVLLALVVAVASLPRVRRQIFGDADPKRVPEMLNNKAFVESQGKCVISSDADASIICDRIGKRLRANLPLAIQKGDCPSACNDDEKSAIVLIIKTLKEQYPEMWDSVIKHYKATPDQLTKLDTWVASVTSTAAPTA